MRRSSRVSILPLKFPRTFYSTGYQNLFNTRPTISAINFGGIKSLEQYERALEAQRTSERMSAGFKGKQLLKDERDDEEAYRTWWGDTSGAINGQLGKSFPAAAKIGLALNKEEQKKILELQKYAYYMRQKQLPFLTKKIYQLISEQSDRDGIPNDYAYIKQQISDMPKPKVISDAERAAFGNENEQRVYEELHRINEDYKRLRLYEMLGSFAQPGKNEVNFTPEEIAEMRKKELEQLRKNYSEAVKALAGKAPTHDAIVAAYPDLASVSVVPGSNVSELPAENPVDDTNLGTTINLKPSTDQLNEIATAPPPEKPASGIPIVPADPSGLGLGSEIPTLQVATEDKEEGEKDDENKESAEGASGTNEDDKLLRSSAFPAVPNDLPTNPLDVVPYALELIGNSTIHWGSHPFVGGTEESKAKNRKWEELRAYVKKEKWDWNNLYKDIKDAYKKPQAKTKAEDDEDDEVILKKEAAQKAAALEGNGYDWLFY